MKVSVKVPATIANLGCGFDCFGLAIPIYNTVTIEETVLPGTGVEISIVSESNNEVINIPTDKNNICYKAIELLYGYIGQIPSEMKISIKTSIPIARGLGSSSSVIVGGLMAANELLGSPADESVLLSIATELEGHPDNVTPAIVGGLTISSLEEDGSVIYRKLPWPEDWKITVCVPDYELATDISRSVLPAEVSLKDAVFNLKKAAMFVESIHTKDKELMKISLKDRLHQPYRMKLVPGMGSVMESLKHTPGVIGTVLSGAGPSITVFSNSSALDSIKETVTKTWNDINVSTKIYTLPLEETGARKI